MFYTTNQIFHSDWSVDVDLFSIAAALTVVPAARYITGAYYMLVVKDGANRQMENSPLCLSLTSIPGPFANMSYLRLTARDSCIHQVHFNAHSK